MALNGFDAIARIYDPLARLFFGNNIKRSQLYFLDQIPAHANILILGGGTGWILNEILKVNPTCEVWYVEASAKMIVLSKRNTSVHKKIHFIHGTEKSIPNAKKYDVVITNFYLDLFRAEKISDVINHICTMLNQGSYWIATDFMNEGKWWQSLLLKLMYSFFRITADIDSKELPDWSFSLQKSGLSLMNSKSFFHGFMKTTIFKRTSV